MFTEVLHFFLDSMLFREFTSTSVFITSATDSIERESNILSDLSLLKIEIDRYSSAYPSYKQVDTICIGTKTYTTEIRDIPFGSRTVWSRYVSSETSEMRLKNSSAIEFFFIVLHLFINCVATERTKNDLPAHAALTIDSFLVVNNYHSTNSFTGRLCYNRLMTSHRGANILWRAGLFILVCTNAVSKALRTSLTCICHGHFENSMKNEEE